MHSRRILLLAFLITTPISVRAENYYANFLSSIINQHKKSLAAFGITSAVAVGTYITYRAIDSFCSWLFKKKNDNTPYITIGKAKVEGSRTIMHSQVVKQIVPYPQLDATCGYHCILNSALIANECLLQKGQLTNHIKNNTLSKKLIDKGGLWREYIRSKQEEYIEDIKNKYVENENTAHKKKYGIDLSDAEKKRLYREIDESTRNNMQDVLNDQELYENQIVDFFALETGGKKIAGRADLNHTVLDKSITFEQFGFNVVNRSNATNKKEFDNAINKIKKIKGPYVHAFIINTADTITGNKTSDFGSHWIVHVVFKNVDGRIEHIIADSLAINAQSNSFDNPVVNGIIQALN